MSCFSDHHGHTEWLLELLLPLIHNLSIMAFLLTELILNWGFCIMVYKLKILCVWESQEIRSFWDIQSNNHIMVRVTNITQIFPAVAYKVDIWRFLSVNSLLTEHICSVYGVVWSTRTHTIMTDLTLALLTWWPCFYCHPLLKIPDAFCRMRTLWPEMILRTQTSYESAMMAFSCWHSLVSVL